LFTLVMLQKIQRRDLSRKFAEWKKQDWASESEQNPRNLEISWQLTETLDVFHMIIVQLTIISMFWSFQCSFWKVWQDIGRPWFWSHTVGPSIFEFAEVQFPKFSGCLSQKNEPMCPEG
jgi:hypothetical protein